MNDGRAVRAIGLGHGFPGTPLLFESLDFEARPGDVVGLCGPSGSGKSTLLSIFAGWETPSMGRVERVRITRTSWVFQNPHGVAHRKCAGSGSLSRQSRPTPALDRAPAKGYLGRATVESRP